MDKWLDSLIYSRAMKIIKMDNLNMFYILPTLAFYWDEEYFAINFSIFKWTFEIILRDYE
jgi:hypothetical protein